MWRRGEKRKLFTRRWTSASAMMVGTNIVNEKVSSDRDKKVVVITLLLAALLMVATERSW